MKIEKIQNKNEWGGELCKQERAQFLQSWQWGEFQTKMGQKAIRLKMGNYFIQGFEHKLGLGIKYLYLPRISNFDKNEIVEYGKKQGYSFVRIEPVQDLSFFKDDLILTKNRQIQQTIILDLNKSEEDILTVMHSKTRYNIRLAEKKGVEIKLEKNVDIFWKLNSETIKRDRFKSHAKEYYEEMLTLDNVYQLIAYHEGEPIAANILIYFGDTLTYLHGTSASKKRNLMAPYLLQWEGIKLAKKLDCNFYDFWGVAPKAENTEKIQTSCFHNFCWPINHALSGVTRFKAGFGGQYVEYSQAFDIITKPWKYKIYKLIRKLRGLK